MKYKYLLIPLAVILGTILYAQESGNILNGRNPYSSSVGIQRGDIITIVFREGLKAEYEAEYKSNSDQKIRSNPDKKMIPEMNGFESDRSIGKNSQAKSKTNGKLVGRMAATVTSIENSGESFEVEGRREVRFDNERQFISIRGTVARKDFQSDRTVDYNQIANLELVYSGNPSPRNLQNPDIGLKTIQNPDGTTSVSSELSDTEKQEILLRYMRRMLGESGEEGSR
jgi:flagellar L-ring protein precursor FlgH